MTKYKGKRVEWSQVKNNKLIRERLVSFEAIEHFIAQSSTAIIKHPNSDKYPHQWMFIIEMNDYIYLVPFVEDDEKIFLKTIIPSRKFTKLILKR